MPTVRQIGKGDLIGGEFRVEHVFGGEGRSGMGVVYLVTSRDAPFPFVLKTAQQGTCDKRFTREALAWVSVGWHPNIVKALWVRRIDDVPYVAAEYVPPDDLGRNCLAHHIGTVSQSPSLMLRWAAQCCYGLAHAQMRGLRAHRDLKPDNIMIERSGEAKITDFGLASGLLDAKQEAELGDRPTAPRTPSLTVTGSALGTLPYMSPEQFLDAKSVDHRADIYALGIIIYQMATGGLYPYPEPAGAPDVVAAYAQMHSRAAPRGLSSPFQRVISGCLSKDPGKRYQSYDAILSDLATITAELGVSLPPRPGLRGAELGELYMRAQSYSALGQPERAVNAIDEYLSQAPEAYCAWTEKSRLMLELGESSAAVDAATKSLELFPNNSHALNNLGVAYDRLGKVAASIAAFRDALVSDPQNVGAMMNMAQPLVSAGRFAEASAILQKAVHTAPTKKTLLFSASNLAALMATRGGLNEASPLLLLLVEVDRDNPTNWHNLGLLNQARGDRAAAIRCFKEVERREPGDAFCLLNLARLTAESGALPEAIAYCDRLLEMGQEVVNALSLKAQVLSATGHSAEAITMLKRVLRGHPDSDPLWFFLAEVQASTGDRTGALASLEQCRQLLSDPSASPNPDNLLMVNRRIQQLMGEGR